MPRLQFPADQSAIRSMIGIHQAEVAVGLASSPGKGRQPALGVGHRPAPGDTSLTAGMIRPELCRIQFLRDGARETKCAEATIASRIFPTYGRLPVTGAEVRSSGRAYG